MERHREGKDRGRETKEERKRKKVRELVGREKE